MAAPTKTQSDSASSGDTTTASVTLTGVAAGATLIASVHQYGSGNRSFTLSDDNGDTWNEREVEAGSGSRRVGIWDSISVTGGTTEITATASGGIDFYLVVIEISESTFDVSSSFNNSDGQTQYGGASGEIDTSADVFVYSAFEFADGTAAGHTAKSGWTQEFSSGDDWAFSQYIESASALTDERGEFTVTPTNRNANGAIASWVAAGGGPGPTTSPWYYHQNQASVT